MINNRLNFFKKYIIIFYGILIAFYDFSFVPFYSYVSF